MKNLNSVFYVVISESNIDDFTAKQLSLFIIQDLRSLHQRFVETEARQEILMQHLTEKVNKLERETIKDVNTVDVRQVNLENRLRSVESKQDNIISGHTKLPYVTSANLITVLSVIGGVILGAIQLIKLF